MKKFLMQLVGILAFSSILLSAQAQTFKEFVDACKEELGFDSIPTFDCRGEQFRTAIPNTDFSLSNDWVAHRTINNSVDAIFACRWVLNSEGESSAATGEMIVHNRRTGGTCFFDAKKTGNSPGFLATTKPTSPTSSSGDQFWKSSTLCTECHTAGPYIASQQIVGALAKFGLINDGHDTFNNRYYAVEPAFDYKNGVRVNRNWILNDEIQNTYVEACASKCHLVSNSGRSSIGIVTGAIQIPSISMIIAGITPDHMPPTDPLSDYRWLNRDSAGGSGDYETISAFKDDVAEGTIYSNQFICDNPSYMEAHRVGSGVILHSNTLSALRTFNLQDGLVCNNSDFPANHPFKCMNHQTRYKCNGEWTAWFDTDTPSDNVENESRSRIKGLCADPTDIQARKVLPIAGAPWSSAFYGPRDRFAQFNNTGLICKNADQKDGSCLNYVVRFRCPQ